MRKLLIGLFATIVFFSGSVIPLKLLNTAIAQQKPIPPYAKWGTLAMEKTHEKYPNAKIIDYLHIGRKSGPNSTTEKFKLWLKDNSREFGVFVNIEFNNKTEKVIKITFKETLK
ncbi:YqzG/YhdC family protein [Neobacillus sp. WH10]|uniref:YqzG/YhdC family protein n=1 Tax=Neobacillus sp. WH10 TaxID=3047873 RepID=UPI0024C150B0|nr:YqzG/YhdC family protein [Neobacillus sp. WH10]WHY78477.1 YqzG/YhdC family protein [Neobacillus sp. WH10]